MNFDIGTYAWVEININQTKVWEKFLIIGRGDFGKILLDKYPFSLDGYICSESDISYFKINPKYLGAQIKYAAPEYLKYFGKTCQQCQKEFDFLDQENCFTCWGCEL